MIQNLILCPLGPEVKALRTCLNQFGYSSEQVKIKGQSAWLFPQLSSLLAVGGHGKTQFAARSQFFIQNLQELELVICAGVAGALDSQLKPGDVIVGQTTIEHDYHLKFEQRSLPQFPGSRVHLEKLAQRPSAQIFIGKIASGDEDILTRERAQQIYDKTEGALAVSWEGAGGARATLMSQLDFLEIRGITDICNGQSLEDFKIHFPLAMKAVAQTVLHILRDSSLEVSS